MQQSMRLDIEPFERISNGTKTIEIRIYDEKRQTLKVGDIIEFVLRSDVQRKILVKVIGLLLYRTFRDLVEDFSMECFGYPKDYPIEDFLASVYQIYSSTEEKLYGVVGIKFELHTP